MFHNFREMTFNLKLYVKTHVIYKKQTVNLFCSSHIYLTTDLVPTRGAKCFA